ncbi:winged helix-turn-helix domain-containing protein, partial [bacterium]|nr:winged helix-turn-helix domain-containing protein [bacterium]
YFCLPIFIGNQAVARIDCKAYRKEKKLVVNSIHYEKGLDKESLQLHGKLKSKLEVFADFNGCTLDF